MNEELSQIEHLFLAFGDKTRLQLLYLLRDGEVSVNALSDALNSSQPKISRHLAYLRTMNVVTTRREGKNIYYKLHLPSNPFGVSLVEETIDWLDSFSGTHVRSRRPRQDTPLTTEAPVAQPFVIDEHQSEKPNEGQPKAKSELEFVEAEEMEIYLL